MNSLRIDSRLKKNIENIQEWENGVYSLKMKDIQDTFWFNNIIDMSEFLNEQARERYYDKSLRKGQFTYLNEYDEKIVYTIDSVNRGTIVYYD